jgi:predicted lipid-binding transport protein (Tim44 family)
MLLVGGLLSLTFLLPGENKKPGLLPPLFTLGATLGLLFGVFTTAKAFEMGAGGIMVMIFSIIQTIVAVVAYLFDAGIIKAPQPNPYAQQQQQFGAPQTGQFGAPQQFQQQPPPVQQPGQQTTYAPQQGQFGQQPPGTPPGGFGGQA